MRAVDVAFILVSVFAVQSVAGQERELPTGFQKVNGKYVDIVTDMPLTDELRELPAVFDAAVPLWCQAFGMPLDEVSGWHTQAFIMLDRTRFQNAGLIPSNLPPFVYGFQFGDQLWVTEQPSAYYRRHLLLHEGTHWFMNRKFGHNGPPWLMEGMAEWLATHAWGAGQLRLGWLPPSKTDVPYWGRISLIQQQLADQTAPSLENILRYSDTAHQRVDAYAWSWAAVIFLQNHPEASPVFQDMLAQPMRDDASMTRWLFNALRSQWPRLRQDWQAFVTELEYGYDPSRGMLLTSADCKTLSSVPQDIEIRADRSWQSSGWCVRSPAKLRVAAKGRFSVAQTPSFWTSEPQGVTLEYYRGQPLGKLMLCIAAPINTEPDTTMALQIVPIGVGGEFDIETAGELFFKVNEASGGLADNTGILKVTVSQ